MKENNILEDIFNMVEFIKELEKLKNETRTAWTSIGKKESIAEHSWRLSVFSMILEGYIDNVDFARIIKMCLIHDLGEIYDGDISAKIQADQFEKFNDEEQAVLRLTKNLSENNREKILSLWYEYNSGKTKESKVAKVLDKIETIIQHNQGENPAGFDYEFNIGYGRKYIESHEILTEIRKIVDEDTRKEIEKKKLNK